MKLQNLIIIFIIIIIPIIFIFSLYLNLETKTITMQTDMDGKLIEATKEAMEAFEINTVEWNSDYSSIANTKRQALMSSINIFTSSLADKLKIGGISKENILTYIPAIVFTMYDGYYIYSPTYVPETITNENGVQYFYYKDSGSEGAKVIAAATQNIGGTIASGEPIYYLDNSIAGAIATGIHNGESFTTNVEYAKKTYKHVLKTFVPYTYTYNNYVINYTLDNYIRIYSEIESKEGYVLNSSDTISVSPNGLISGITFNSKEIEPEILVENVYVRDNISDEAQLKTYAYIYNSANDKRYYDSTKDKFFIINQNHVKIYLPQIENPGETLAEYKKVLVCIDGTNFEYLELYQLLNGNNLDWYYKDTNNQYVKYEKSDLLNTQIERRRDCSAINYYVETKEFNYWLERLNFPIDDIMDEKRNSIIENINDNLNLSISNYNANAKAGFNIFELTDEDWNQVLSNISMITFFQGKRIGLKTYNNYAIVTSTENNEFISEDSLYYIGTNGDNYYHRYNCIDGNPATFQAYKNTDFKIKSYDSNDGSIKYYYKHTGNMSQQLQQCFNCIVNRNNISKATGRKEQNYNKTYYTALARERYILMNKTKLT